MAETAATGDASRSQSATLLPILATIAFVLCLPILVNHITSRNLAASMLVFWIVLENIYNLINPLLWPTNDFNSWWNGIGLCDIESKLRLAAYIGYISALVCIYRQLAIILNTEQIVLVPTSSQRRCRTAIELALCFGFPIFIMIAHYVVQSGRYYIFAITGCVPMLDSSWPTILLVLIWPGVMWVVAAAYCFVIIYRLARHRRQVSSILSAPHCRYNQSQFVRLFAMATALILVFLPLALYLLVQNLSHGGGRPSYSWSRIHEWKDSIILMPSDDGENFGRWIEVATGYVVFVSFGLGRDGLLMYRSVLLKMGLGRIFPGLKPPRSQEAILHSNRHIPLEDRLESISSHARLIFHRLSSDRPLSVPNTSSSIAKSATSPTTAGEKKLNRGSTQLPPASPTDRVNMPVSENPSAEPCLLSLGGKAHGSITKCQEEDSCMDPLIQEPLAARVRSTHGLALRGENQNVITVTKEVKESDTVKAVR